MHTYVAKYICCFHICYTLSTKQEQHRCANHWAIVAGGAARNMERQSMTVKLNRAYPLALLSMPSLSEKASIDAASSSKLSGTAAA